MKYNFVVPINVLKVKGKFYRTVVKPTMMYGSERGNKNESCGCDNAKVNVWGVTRWNRIRNECIRSFGVTNIDGKTKGGID